VHSRRKATKIAQISAIVPRTISKTSFLELQQVANKNETTGMSFPTYG
jgi:hypothetical protein